MILIACSVPAHVPPDQARPARQATASTRAFVHLFPGRSMIATPAAYFIDA